MKSKTHLLSALFCLILVFVSLPAHASKHALLIGIADYSGTDYSSLDGTINDLELVRGLLKDKFKFTDGEIRIIKDAKATHKGIQMAFSDLAKKVGKDDIVYIHYSGHGSRTRDLTGEKKPMVAGGIAYDSTWVSYGSRSKSERDKEGGKANLDNYDILDDEIGEWLVPVFAKTDNVIFVSDSCHSGNMTRGEAPKVRAIAVDLRPHPLGKRKFAHVPKGKGVIVGAAREDQLAGEYASDDNKSYGLFTYNWVSALQKTSPGDTWDEAFKRTVSLIGSRRETQQHPQIEGEVKRSIFGGDFPVPVQSLSITDVTDEGKVVVLRDGTFAGITVGSIYKKKGKEDTFKITEVQPFSSKATVTKGSFVKGDLANEESHAYPYTPIKVFVTIDPALSLHSDSARVEAVKADTALADTLKVTVAGIPGYVLVSSQKTADFMLMVIRPKRTDGKPEYEVKKDGLTRTLPIADPLAAAEIWMLTPEELPTREIMPMQPASNKRAIELVAENLKKMSRIRELKKIGADDNSGSSLIELIISHYTPDAACQGAGAACLDVPNKGKYRLVATMPSLQMQDKSLLKGDILTFRIKNNSSYDLYCYLIDITPNGKISAIFPAPQDSNSSVLVPARKEQDFSDMSGLEIEEPGEDTLKLIATPAQLDVRLFEQEGYKTRGETKGSENPLENFLSRSMGNVTRGSFSMKKNQWGTVQISFEGK